MAQPLNAAISVTNRIRVYYANSRFSSIKELTAPFGDRKVMVPGEEVRVLETRDSNYSDGFPNGHRVVVEPRVACTLAQILAGVPGMAEPTRMFGNPREIQLGKKAAYVADDLWGQAQAVCPNAAHPA